VSYEGEHYRLDGARPGPSPAHPVEIWLGAYKPRMLALTGTSADGWLPSLGYADMDALPAMNAAIDEAAQEAGRDPAEIRRLFNVNGRFGSDGGFLQGTPSDWANQLAELTLTAGMSTYILAADSDEDIHRFAEDVAPAVRELVEAGRSSPAAEHAPTPVPATRAAPFAVTPTPDDGTRLSDKRPWDEAGRPTGPAPDSERRYSAHEQAAGQHLVDVHDALRAEMARIRELIEQVERGALDPSAVRSLINRMTIRQNNWTLGAYCEAYCRTVSQHHTLEDTGIFPHLRRRDERLAPVIRRLEEEHEVIAELLDGIDASLVAVVASEDDALARLRAAMDLLTDAMLSHLSYEERELVEPLARLGFY
jgi:hemerythrin-like domain-containing protein